MSAKVIEMPKRDLSTLLAVAGQFEGFGLSVRLSEGQDGATIAVDVRDQAGTLLVMAQIPAQQFLDIWSSLPEIDLEGMLALTVTDGESEKQAVAIGKQAKAYRKTVTKAFELPVRVFHSLHTLFTGLRGNFVESADNVVKHSDEQLLAYRNLNEQRRLEMQGDLRRQQEERLEQERRAVDEAIALAREVEELFGMASLPEDAPIAAPRMPEAPIIIASEPLPDGVTTPFKPWEYEVFDKPALIKAAAADSTLENALEVNDRFMKGEVKTMGAELEKKYPGVRGVRRRRVQY